MRHFSNGLHSGILMGTPIAEVGASPLIPVEMALDCTVTMPYYHRMGVLPERQGEATNYACKPTLTDCDCEAEQAVSVGNLEDY